MSKFLEGVERYTPTESGGKRNFTVEYKDIDGTLMATAVIPFNVGSSYENFLKFVEISNGTIQLPDEVPDEIPVEDSETVDIQKAAKTAAAVLAIPDQGIGKQLLNPAARKVQMAKRILADKLKKAVDTIQF
jgi:hypothetical protein